MTETDAPRLCIRAVRKTFGEQAVVRGFDLDVAAGEFVSLLGPSGCGKTTLLRMVAGFEVPDSGTIEIEGEDVGRLPAHRRPVNMVFQRVTLFPHLDVAENIGFGLRLARVPAEAIAARVASALALVRLPGFESRAVSTLSGGQAQRIALARAIVNRPKVLLFDEPLSSLDLQIRRQLQVELKDIHRETGGTFVYVTHDQEEAMSMSDRVVVMREGEIVQVGTPLELYRRPSTPFVAEFLGNANLLEGRIVAVEGGSVLVDVGGARVRGTAASTTLRVGDAAVAVLRAESLEPVPAGAPSREDGLALAGRVADVRFVGSAVHHRVEAAGRTLAVTRPFRGEESVLAEGGEVMLTWDPGEVRVLPGERSER